MLKLPDVDELVLAKVKKILPYGAFCTLDEYDNHEAFLHISEVAPRWIKNIHEFLNEGQRLVCKVHRVTPEKSQVDISLKRVTEADKKRKLEFKRRETRSEKLFEVAKKISKCTPAQAQDAKKTIETEYGDVYSALEEMSEIGFEAIEDLKITKSLADALVDISKKSIKKPKAILRPVLQIASYKENGVEVIKQTLGNLEVPKECEEVDINYLGAPRYQFTIIAKDYKLAKKAQDKIHRELEKNSKSRSLLIAWENES